MDQSLNDRVVLITGGGRGFGWLIAERLLREGAKVFLTASRKPEELTAVQGQVDAIAGPGHCEVLQADVSDPDACQRTVDAAMEAFGRIDVLINNAGRGSREYRLSHENPTRFYELPDVAWRTIIDTNVNGCFQMARRVAPHMIEQEFGKIINLSTSLATMVMLGLSPYGASKAALETATVVWAKDLEGTGVDANVLLPGGPSDTEFITEAMVPGKVGERTSLLPADVVVEPAAWLCSDASNGITGRRFIGKFWDTGIPLDQAAAASVQPQHETPNIM